MTYTGFTAEHNYKNSHVYQMDCMELMRQTPDNYFDLGVVDPPYGLGFDGQKKSTSSHGGRKAFPFKGWDSARPPKDYFKELFRVTKNQIIWGGNYFANHLPSSMGWIFWDKGQRIRNSDGELAFTSFDKALRVFELNRVFLQTEGGSIHPTQKPIALYSWILDNYAKPGWKILDTHLGSQSSRIAAYKKGFEFWATELDAYYFNEGNERFMKAVKMPLFENLPPEQLQMF